MLNVLLNIALFTGKFIVGKISGSVSIIADAFNNLTDAGTVCLTAMGIKVASLGPGQRHPNGHGKFEWIIALITSLSVFLVGWELLKNSCHAIKNPSDTVFSYITLIVLLASIGVKLFLYIYNLKKSKTQGFISLKAVAVDSLSDAISTCAVLLSLLLNTWFGWKLDGFFGIVVAIVILFNSVRSCSDSFELLLGKAASDDDIRLLKNTIKELCPDIGGIYDTQIEDFGYGRKKAFISISPMDGVTAGKLVTQSAILTEQIKQKLQYNCLISVESTLNSAQQNEIIKTASQKIKDTGYNVELRDARVVKTTNGIHILRMIVNIIWDKKYDMKEIEKFVSLPANLGMRKNDLVSASVRMGRYDYDTEKYRGPARRRARRQKASKTQ